MAESMYAYQPVNNLLSSYEACQGGSNLHSEKRKAAINYDTPFWGYLY
jgi:hypothetical protein